MPWMTVSRIIRKSNWYDFPKGLGDLAVSSASQLLSLMGPLDRTPTELTKTSLVFFFFFWFWIDQFGLIQGTLEALNLWDLIKAINHRSCCLPWLYPALTSYAALQECFVPPPGLMSNKLLHLTFTCSLCWILVHHPIPHPGLYLTNIILTKSKHWNRDHSSRSGTFYVDGAVPCPQCGGGCTHVYMC